MPGKEQKSKMRQAVASLHREMEVAPKKRITRDESLKRTKRRKKLEKEEKHEFELLVDEAATTRLRGSEAAYGDEVVQDSLMFQKPRRTKRYKTNSPSLKSSNETDRSDEDDDNEEDKVNENELEEGDEEENDEGDEEDAEDEDPEKGQKTATSSTKKKSKRRTRYRLKNFQSVRMAQRHGDALKFHARGQPKLAIEALKKVAQDAPSAPQVYSSLGMVYEDMLRESLKRSQRASVPDISAEEQTIDTLFDKGDVLEQDQTIPDSNLAEQLDFSKKAYGSYHVAAILCKQDFSLWIKAADCAIDTAEIHGRAMVLTNVSMEIREYHRSEKQRWYAEALGDLKVADNLKPPGIEVPAKLASTCMEVGKLSEVSPEERV
jgi:Fe-S cluster assembly iron-binding protein IscA